MSVLVIGGNGFIGSHVVDALVAAGAAVTVFDRAPERFRAPLSGVRTVLGDFRDTAAVAAALDGVESVVHLASSTVPSTSNLDPAADIADNLVSTVRLLEAMRGRGIRRLVYMSSGGTVYGPPRVDPVPEDHPLAPISSYGIVKVAVENYLAMEGALHGLGAVALRCANPYGPRQGHLGVQGVIGTFLWKIARGETPEIWGDGSIVRDFIHVRDVARLVVRALGDTATGPFNVGSGRGHSIREVVDAIGRAVGGPVLVTMRPGRGFDVPRVVLDCSRAERTFGWRPAIDLDEGLAETWAFVRSEAAKG